MMCLHCCVTGEEMCIETRNGEKIKDEDEDIYQFLPLKKEEVIPEANEDILEGGVPNEAGPKIEFQPYTQIWLCGRGDRKGVLQVFTYNDGHVGHSVSLLYTVIPQKLIRLIPLCMYV